MNRLWGIFVKTWYQLTLFQKYSVSLQCWIFPASHSIFGISKLLTLNPRSTMIRTLYIALFLFFLLPSMSAQRYTITPLPNTQQLPVNEVTAILQDHEGYMWYGTSDGLCRDDGYDIRVLRSDFHTPGVLTRNFVNVIAEDSKGHIWYSTRKGVYILDPKTFRNRSLDIDDLPERYISFIASTHDGNVWVGGTHMLYRFDSDGTLQERMALKSDVACFYEDSRHNFFMGVYDDGLYCRPAGKQQFQRVLPGFTPTCMVENNFGNGYIMAQEGLYAMDYDPQRQGAQPQLTQLPTPKDDMGWDVTFFTGMVQSKESGYTWLMSYYRGLFAIRPDGTQIVLPDNFRTLSGNMMNALYLDHSGRVWISGFNTGCNVILPTETNITNIGPAFMREKLQAQPTFMDVVRDEDGIFWAFQDRQGLYLFDPAKQVSAGHFENPLLRPLQLYQIKCLELSADTPRAAWVAYYGNRIVLLQRNGMRLAQLRYIDLQHFTDTSGEIECLRDVGDGRLWIGTQNGLFIYDIMDETLSLVPGSEGQIVSIDARPGHGAWYAMRDGGAFFHSLRPQQTKSQIIDTPFGITAIASDHHGHLWIASAEGGVWNYDVNASRLVDYTDTLGLDGNAISKIVIDQDRQAWIVSNQRIRKYDPRTRAIINISTSDHNVMLSRILPRAVYYDRKESAIYFGGIPGIMRVSTAAGRMQGGGNRKQLTLPRITDIQSSGRSILFDSLRHTAAPGSPNDVFIIRSDDQDLQVNFSDLGILQTGSTRYAYRLLGLSDEWVYLIPGRNEASFSGLPKGNYTFQVKSMGINGVWGPGYTELRLQRLPGWYETTLAYVIYMLLIMAIIAYVAWRYQQHIHRRGEKRLAEQMVQTKLRYFTNISHELLTPLAVISSINDSIEPVDEGQSHKLTLIRSNIARLNYLLQQILDFRKVETGNIKLYVEQGNLSQLIEQRCRESFMPLAGSKNIQIVIEKPFEDVSGYFDRDKIDKILFNLVSNAIKYSHEDKQVTIRLSREEGQAVIAVQDQGIGIENRELKKVFQRFYNTAASPLNESNGIGLSLTKELIELHHGTISVQSQAGRGSTFTIRFPIESQAYTQLELKDRRQDEQVGLLRKEISRMHIDRQPSTDLSLLVVEDNVDMLTALEELLSKHYHVFTASNGVDALGVIREHPGIQFVVSDISMPGMDGLELCRRLKRDIDTSHLVVIMLTAMRSSQNQIDSYDAGADAYLPKPFESKVLIALLANLWTHRRQRQQDFRTDPGKESASSLQLSEIDRQFVDRAIKVVSDNMASPQFGVDFLASELCMSRATLTRKFRSLLDQTPLEFIRTVKFKHAYRLLQSHNYTVIEVVEAVGYNDRHTFSQTFREIFGVLPSKV